MRDSATPHRNDMDWLLRQAVGAIALAHHADCAVWCRIDLAANVAWVYATGGIAERVALDSTPAVIQKAATEESGHGEAAAVDPVAEQQTASRGAIAGLESQPLPVVHPYRVSPLPLWVIDQVRSPHRMQFEDGTLVQPLPPPTVTGSADEALPSADVPFLLQLHRPHTAAPERPNRAVTLFTTEIEGWAKEELAALKAQATELSLAYSSVYWRHKLAQARLHIARLGRITHLLNSYMEPDGVVQTILAELGQEFGCDRTLLVQVSAPGAALIANWAADTVLEPSFSFSPEADAAWQTAAALFLQDGVSYLQVEPLNDELAALRPLLPATQTLSLLLLPVFIQQELFGIVALAQQDGHSASLEQVQWVSQVVDYLAIALTQLQHTQSLRHHPDAQWLPLPPSTLQADAPDLLLTHCLAREALEDELKQLSSKALWAEQPVFCILMCDIDYFKLINDAHGYPAGDGVLQTLVERLRHQLRKDTPIYRHGGEEFVMILRATPLALATDIAERLQQVIRGKPFWVANQPLTVTTSIGIAQKETNLDATAWDVMHRAEQALLQAKRQGRNCVNAQ